jgi:hypothetical protein
MTKIAPRINGLIATASLFSLSLPARVFAVTPDRSCKTQADNFLGFPTWYKYIIDPASSTTECILKFDPRTDIPKLLLAVFEIILRVGGLVAVGFIIYGGIQYLISQGEPEKTKGARTTIINALVGLFISMSAVAIVNLIGKNI